MVSSWSPDDGPELEDLRGYAGPVTNRIFRPPNHLSPVVGACGKAVIATQRGKRPHLTILPHKSQTGIADIVSSGGEERRATPALSQWFRRGSLGNTNDNAPVIFHGPGHVAVRPTECAEVKCHSMSPQDSVPAQISRQVRITRHPAPVVDAIAYVSRSTESGEVNYIILHYCLIIMR